MIIKALYNPDIPWDPQFYILQIIHRPCIWRWQNFLCILMIIERTQPKWQKWSFFFPQKSWVFVKHILNTEQNRCFWKKVSCMNTRHMDFFMLIKKYEGKMKMPITIRYQGKIHFWEVSPHIHLFENFYWLYCHGETKEGLGPNDRSEYYSSFLLRNSHMFIKTFFAFHLEQEAFGNDSFKHSFSHFFFLLLSWQLMC